jgi:hypothetical protein
MLRRWVGLFGWIVTIAGAWVPISKLCRPIFEAVGDWELIMEHRPLIGSMLLFFTDASKLVLFGSHPIWPGFNLVG